MSTAACTLRCPALRCAALPCPCAQTASHASGDPGYEEMRAALLLFESCIYYYCPPRDRAFYKSLRSVLTEVAVDSNLHRRSVRLASIYAWFKKQR